MMFFKRTIDNNGLSVIVGLTYEETIELEALDQTPPIDANGDTAWYFQGGPRSASEQRWLELYEQHRIALGLLRLRTAMTLLGRRE